MLRQNEEFGENRFDATNGTYQYFITSKMICCSFDNVKMIPEEMQYNIFISKSLLNDAVKMEIFAKWFCLRLRIFSAWKSLEMNHTS